MQFLERDGFTREQIVLALHSPHRRISFRYELLDSNGVKKADLHNVIAGEVAHDSFNTIKRTARFTLADDGTIDYLSDRIKPFVRVYVPDGRTMRAYAAFYSQQFSAEFETITNEKAGGWAEFSLGEFLLASPTRRIENGVVTREIDAFDGLVILRDDKFADRYTVTAGTNYRQAVIDILAGAGITRYNIEDSDKTLTKAVEFEPGREKLFAINELLRAINFEPIHVDVNGYYTTAQYRSPAERAAEYTYVTDSSSVTFDGIEETLDLFDVANRFVVVRTNAEEEPLRAEYTNSNAESPTSTVSRGRTIVDYREVDDIADQSSLDAYVERIAFEASQVYGKISFETAIMPMHDYNDVLSVEFTEMGVSGKYAETSWSMPLAVGGRMRHEVRRVVTV